MSLQTYREAFILNAGAPAFGEQQTNGLSAGQVTQYFSMTPRGGNPYVLGAFFNFVGVATATGAESPTAGTDQLDPFIGGGGTITVSAASGGAQRGQTLTRQFAEFIYAVVTNTSFTIAANTTFASASTSNYSVTLYVPIGGTAAVVQFQLPGAVTNIWSSGVTFSYTSITSYIVSSSWSGVVVFNEEKTASLGSGLQTVTNYVPQAISPDAVFMQGESSTTITQVYIQTVTGFVLVTSTATSVVELGAAAVAPVAGTTYTTGNGFVIMGNQQAFGIFQLTFASATTHFIGYLQCAGGQDVLSSPTPAPTAAPPATNQVGTVTPSGGVTWAGQGGSTPSPPGVSGPGSQVSTGGGRGIASPLGSGGTAGGIISRRST